MDLSRPRIVLVTRKTRREVLLERHGTAGQAAFYMVTRAAAQAVQRGGVPMPAVLSASPQKQSGEMQGLEQAHERSMQSLSDVQRAIPSDQRQVRVDRDSLDRFVFEENDIVLVVGQDGLVPNTAKYLSGQFTIGINTDPQNYEGSLVQHSPAELPALLAWAEAQLQREDAALDDNPQARRNLLHSMSSGPYRIQQRVMAEAIREDGQRLLALNEVFIGHQSHQSARYRLISADGEERQSSSGVLCCTGTGSTGWARSMAQQIQLQQELPQPEELRLIWFVREPWQSVSSGASLRLGSLGPGMYLEASSEMGEGGVIFADGIESDRLEFLDGQSVRVGIAQQRLNLVVKA
ncbi:hypothetical protein IT575_15240 [bacterium]|nr:hypothetical protein [bacterium]